MRSLRCGASLLVLFVAVLVVTGCGGTVLDDAKTEAAVEQYLRDSVGKQVKAVDCPSGVDVEKGATFECDVTLAGGERETATLKILNEDADFEVAKLKGQ